LFFKKYPMLLYLLIFRLNTAIVVGD